MFRLLLQKEKIQTSFLRLHQAERIVLPSTRTTIPLWLRRSRNRSVFVLRSAVFYDAMPHCFSPASDVLPCCVSFHRCLAFSPCLRHGYSTKKQRILWRSPVFLKPGSSFLHRSVAFGQRCANGQHVSASSVVFTSVPALVCTHFVPSNSSFV